MSFTRFNDDPCRIKKQLQESTGPGRYILPLDPQENTCIPFQNNLNTRILEKDNFVATLPCVPNDNSNSNVLSASAFRGFGNNINVNNCTKTQTCGTLK